MNDIEEKIEQFEERAIPINRTVPQDTNPAGLLQIAVSQGADLAKLEKLMELQERWEANEARKAYTKAMATFKTNPPKILKDAHVMYKAGGGTTEYNHATLGQVASAIGTALSEHGLSAAWKTEQNGQIIVTCTITHEQGHSESTSLSADADTSGSKNAIQAIGSTITYLQRYTLLALTGIAAKDQDDDGRNSEPIAYITEEQLANLEALLKWLKIDKIEDLPQSKYAMVIKHLEAKREKSDGENN